MDACRLAEGCPGGQSAACDLLIFDASFLDVAANSPA
jgi:hypothetical protein